MAYEYVNSFLLLLHPHFLIKNGDEADIDIYDKFINNLKSVYNNKIQIK